MKKFTANYLVTDSGEFLKNGIIVLEDDGSVLQYIDTSGDLKEIAQLIFHNGILMANLTFSKTKEIIPVAELHSFDAIVMMAFEGLDSFSILQLVDLAKNIQEKFPEMRIPEIMNRISEGLISNAGFCKKYIPGLFLLTSVDLPRLHFKPTSKLKKII